jgi:hypothetical protein
VVHLFKSDALWKKRVCTTFTRPLSIHNQM